MPNAQFRWRKSWFSAGVWGRVPANHFGNHYQILPEVIPVTEVRLARLAGIDTDLG